MNFEIDYFQLTIDVLNRSISILFYLENLDVRLYDIIDFIDWVIVKNWNLLSHNSIVLREYKIPSIIKYNKYSKLKIWGKFILEG